MAMGLGVRMITFPKITNVMFCMRMTVKVNWRVYERKCFGSLKLWSSYYCGGDLETQQQTLFGIFNASGKIQTLYLQNVNHWCHC